MSSNFIPNTRPDRASTRRVENMKNTDLLVKRYQLEHLVPFALTIVSIYIWVTFLI